MDRVLRCSGLDDSLSVGVWRLSLGILTVVGGIVGILIAGLPLGYAGLAVAGCGFVAVLLIEPLSGVILSLLIGPLTAWLQIAAPGVPHRVGQMAFTLALGSWLARGLARRKVEIPTPPLLTPLVGLLGVYLLTLWSPEDVWVGFLEFAKWGQILLVFLVASRRLREGPSALVGGVMITGLLASGLIQAGAGLWQFVGRGDGPEAFLISGRLYRAYGTFQQPNPYAGLVGMVAAVAVGLSAGMWDGWLRGENLETPWAFLRRLWVSLAALILVAGLFASWSRGGWMGFAAAILVMAALFPRRGFWGVVGIGVFLLAGWTAYRAGWLPGPISERMTGFLAYTRFSDVRGVAVTDASYAVLERMAHWQAALGMWRDRFWLGVGLGCYEPAYPAYRLANWPLALGHAHNAYLNLLAETGLLGLSAYLLWLVLWGGRLIAVLHRLSGWRRGLALGLIGAWCQFATHSLVDNLLVNDVHLHIGLMLALSGWLIAGVKGGWVGASGFGGTRWSLVHPRQ